MNPLSAEHETIRVCYEELGRSIEEIATDRGMEVSIVKAALLQCSPLFRKEFKTADEGDGLDFTNDDLKQMNEIILNTAKYAESEELRFKAATYVRDDKKGRKEVMKAVQNNTFNLLEWNERFRQSQSLADRIKGAITIPAESVPA